ncbi:MAG: hypothetical protein ACLGII_15480 [Gammaproteobacteria bacterium]
MMESGPQGHSLCLDAHRKRLSDGSGRVFDPASRSWQAAGDGELISARRKASSTKEAPIDLLAAARWLQRESGHPVRVPVGVIGPRDPTPAQYAIAEAVGGALAQAGLALICGGRSGIMEAACKGAAAHGGTAIGLLPDADPGFANPWASVVIATGIGEARNAIIARSALCLVAIGDSFGTLSEVALGRQFGKTVVALEGAARIDGVVAAGTVDEAMHWVAACALGLVQGGATRA